MSKRSHWLLPECPTIQEGTDIVNDIYIMEGITISLRLKKNVFIKLWVKWVEYVKPRFCIDVKLMIGDFLVLFISLPLL